MISNFSQDELEAVYEKFKKMDQSSTGQLSRADFVEYRQNEYKRRSKKKGKVAEKIILPMDDRLWLLFDPNGKGHVDFRQFVEIMSAMSIQGPRDGKIRLAFKMMDFDNDGKISEIDIKEYLMRVTGLLQTKENVAAYLKALDQAEELAKQSDDTESTPVRKFKSVKETERHLRHRRLQAARSRTRASIEVADLESKDSGGSSKKAPLQRSRSEVESEEKEIVEKLRVDLISTMAHTVILEAASNKTFLTLQDFSKVVDTEPEFFSHMNLFL